MDPITLSLMAGGLYLSNKLKKRFGSGSPPSPRPSGDLSDHCTGAGPIGDGNAYCWIAVREAVAHRVAAALNGNAKPLERFMEEFKRAWIRGEIPEPVCREVIQQVQAATDQNPHSTLFAVRVGKR